MLMPYFYSFSPSPELSAYIRQYTVLKVNSPSYPVQRVIPTGCIELIVYKAGKVKRKDDSTEIPAFFLGGKMSGYLDLMPVSGEVHYISILFQPGGARLFFDLPINELYDRLLSLDDTGDKSWVELCNRITDISDVHAIIQVIQHFLINKLSDNKLLHLRRIMNSVHTLYTASATDLDTLAADSCLSRKQFKRVFQHYVGCNPKEFMRIVRFNKVLQLLKTRKSSGFAQIAHEAGYSDQSHLIREFKIFSGYTPLRFLAPEVGLHHFT